MAIRIVEQNSTVLRLREDARRASSIPWFCLAFLFAAITFRAQESLGTETARLSAATVGFLAMGLNRLFGMLCTFDVNQGTVSVARTLGRMVVFRRTFMMKDVKRVFHDRRPYLRIKTLNPKLQLISGRQVNLSWGCPVGHDLEREVNAANRMLHTWKRTKAGIEESFTAAYADASPANWTLEGLNALGTAQIARDLYWVKRSGIVLLLSIGLFISLRESLPSALVELILLGSLAAFTGILIFGLPLLIERWGRKLVK